MPHSNTELYKSLLMGAAAVLMSVMGFIGVRLWGQVDANTAAVNNQAVVDAAMVEQIKNLDKTLEGLKDAINGLIDHEVEHRDR